MCTTNKFVNFSYFFISLKNILRNGSLSQNSSEAKWTKVPLYLLLFVFIFTHDLG
jgi:hypothetical protein